MSIDINGGGIFCMSHPRLCKFSINSSNIAVCTKGMTKIMDSKGNVMIRKIFVFCASQSSI